jgi:iron(III) transport system substrate-binding protein
MTVKKAFGLIVWVTVISSIISSCSRATTADNISTLQPTPEMKTPTLVLPTSVPTASQLSEYFLPTYYSGSYADVINASKQEAGLVIYSVMPDENWKPVLEAFTDRYPWIQVTNVNLGAEEVFERYNTDIAANSRTADMIVTYSPEGWLSFANSGQVNPYFSEEDFYIPTWAKQAPGIYTIAADPMVMLYNKVSITDPPQRMADLAALATDPARSASLHIITYDASQNSTGLAVNWFWAAHLGKTAWDILQKISRTSPDLMTSASSMVEAVQNGESQIAYFITPIAFLQKQSEMTNIGWTFIRDGQPILMRSAAITKSAQSPNSAKLMMNFLLSQEGQIALALGGMTPFRQDIANVDLFNPSDGVQEFIHFNQVMEAVGLDNIIFISLDPEINNIGKRNTFIETWNRALGR